MQQVYKACLNACLRWIICLIALTGKSESVANLKASLRNGFKLGAKIEL